MAMPPSGTSSETALASIVARLTARARGPVEGLFGPGSAVWRVARENVLFTGAPRALLLQLAHPAILSGVAQHSQVAADPMGRSIRTFEAMYTLTFGDLESAMRVVRTVWKRHQSVRGHVITDTRSPAAGTPYHATDPKLLLWVWATLHDTMVRTYETFVRPLGVEERSAFYEDGKLLQTAFGVPEHDIPPSVRDFDAYVQGVVDGAMLDVPDEARGQWELLVSQPPSSGLVGALMLPRARAVSLLIDGSPVRLLAPAVARLFAAGMLPPRLREGYGLSWSRSDAALYKLLVEAMRRSVALLPRQLRHHAAYRRAMERVRPRKAA
jgi:uncharacterized protein (DUF2236 family)